MKLFTSLLLLLLSFQVQAKEVDVEFTVSQDPFTQVETELFRLSKDGVTIDAFGKEWGNSTTDYRWWQNKKMTISSPYFIRKVVFSKEGAKKDNGNDCSGIKEVDSKNGKLTYNPTNKPNTATWKSSTNVNQITFENTNNAVWLGTITVTIEGPDVIIDGTSSNVDNGSLIASNNDKKNLEVSLKRKFVADGGWYTLCLPFYRTGKQMKEAFGDDVEVCEFTSAKRMENHVQIVFSPIPMGETDLAVNGVPYLIKPSKGTGDEIVFHYVNMHDITPETVEHDGVKFIGIYDPYEIPYNDKHYRFLVGNEGLTLKYSNVEGSKVKGTRAYFVFPDDQSDVAERVAIAGYDAVKVEVVIAGKDGSGAPYYTLSGLKIDGKPAKRGVYIHNGQKVCLP